MKNIKLRYYLRGLGIGVLMTAFIMTVTGDKEVSLTDAQIKERAAALGMVDANTLVLSDIRTDEVTDEPSVGEDKQTDDENAQTVESTDSADVEQETGDTDSADVDRDTGSTGRTEADRESSEGTGETEAAGAEPESESLDNDQEKADADSSSDAEEEAEPTEESVVTGDTVALTIRAGANSYSVSKELENMGLVADAGVFDDYLCDNGYAKIVRVGTYKIVKGTSEEEIAKIITGKR